MSQSGGISSMNSSETTDNTTKPSLFQVHFNSYCDELTGTFPEYGSQIACSRTFTTAQLMKFFNDIFAELRQQSSVSSTSPTSIATTPRPKFLLPNLEMPETLWSSLSSSTQDAIIEYIRVLGMCSFFEGGEASETAQHEWQNFIGEAVNNVDFSKITDFFKNFIGNLGSKVGSGGGEGGDVGGDGHGASADVSGESSTGIPGLSSFPKLPEKFLRGHLARLAEELVRDIRPEDLGLTPELLQQIEESPSRAFDLLVQVFTRNPQSLQTTFQRIGKKLQQKVASGQIKPQEIAREAEELMKEFAENSDFVEMMDSLKSAFGMENMEMAKKAGQEGSARLAAVKARLNKKKESKQNAAAAATATAATAVGVPTQNQIAMPSIDDLISQIENSGPLRTAGIDKKKQKKNRQK